MSAARSAFLSALGALGLQDAALRTRWRQNRLLILGYHGVALDDEHQWDPELYMPAPVLRRRLELIKEAGCRVLALDDAVYDAMVSYLLWKGRERALHWPEVSGPDASVALTADGRSVVGARLRRRAIEQGLSGRDKDALLARLAARLGVDYADILRRLLHLMTLSEAGELARRGVDLRLHTRRHRVSVDEAAFAREVRDNRERLRKLRDSEPTHFCYPGGVYRREFLPWLRDCNVASATTCAPGLASRRDHPLLPPRYIDTARHTEAEFRGWLTGVAALRPRRRQAEATGQFLEVPDAS